MEEPRVPKHKSFYILPNLFTAASLLAGFLAVLWSSSGQYERAALAIFVSALMDGLDGRVARLTGTSSEFGVQFDSLADLVAFGVAPGILVFHRFLYSFERLGIAVAFLFAVCAALRLARFNIQTSTANKRFFTGLPTPAAGLAVAALILVVDRLPDGLQGGFMEGLALIMTAGIACLMVSNIRYASFKELGALKARPFRALMYVILAFTLVVAYPKIFGFLLLFGYIFSGLVYTFIIFPRMARKGNKQQDGIV